MDTWKHGRYIDLWSFVHLLSGMLIGTVFFWVGLPFETALFFAVLLVIAWELYEWLLGIIEVSPNVTFDILIGLSGFLLAAYWYYRLGMPVSLLVTGSIVGLTVLLSLWGFSDLIFRGFR